VHLAGIVGDGQIRKSVSVQIGGGGPEWVLPG
jgi:hypothetical protein